MTQTQLSDVQTCYGPDRLQTKMGQEQEYYELWPLHNSCQLATTEWFYLKLLF